MSRIERWIIYPLLTVLCFAVFGRREWIGVSAVAGEPPAKILDAQVVRILDEKGVARIVLSGKTGSGGPAIEVLDPAGTPRATLAYGQVFGPSLLLSDERGRLGAALYLWEDDRAELVMDVGRRAGIARRTVSLSQAGDGSSGLVFLDAEGSVRARLEIAKDGAARLGLEDGKGKPVWSTPTK